MEDLDLNIDYWFFSNVLKHEIEDALIEIKFETGRDFKGKENDKVVFLTQNPKGYLFSHEAAISTIKKVKNDVFKSYVITITFKNIAILNDNNYLDNYTFSLTRIKDFSNPEKYFKIPFGRFKRVEFEAVTQNNFFVARTKFGKYINALPKEHKIAFIKYFIELEADLYFNDSKYFNEALNILEDYIEHRITQPARYMKQGYAILRSLISKDEISNIGFSNIKNQVDYLEAQYMHCEEFTNIKDYTEGFKDNYELYTSQYEFEKLFRRTPWPIIID